MSLQHFTKESFDQALNGGRLMMVDFWANWCMPCRMLGPVIQQLADQYDGKAVVGKVDVDAEGELAMRYGVMNIPTVIFFKDGKEIAREVGALPPEAFARILDETCKTNGSDPQLRAAPVFAVSKKMPRRPWAAWHFFSCIRPRTSAGC